jgi:hypothetical protein
MKNCIILGSGRSGTSMVAGTLAKAGYYMGDDLMEPTEGNPKGYFESRKIEAINEWIIRGLVYRMQHRNPRLLPRRPVPHQPNFADVPYGAYWLALIPVRHVPFADDERLAEIAEVVSQEPFSFKDPRFCYTLPVWQPYLKNTVFICVFRDPPSTALSILKEVNTEPYLRGLRITYEQALGVWTYMYRHVLEKHRHQGDWLFVHYNQVLSGDGIDRLEQLIAAKLDRNFPDQNLRRSYSDKRVPWATRRVYAHLCRLAGYRGA